MSSGKLCWLCFMIFFFTYHKPYLIKKKHNLQLSSICIVPFDGKRKKNKKQNTWAASINWQDGSSVEYNKLFVSSLTLDCPRFPVFKEVEASTLESENEKWAGPFEHSLWISRKRPHSLTSFYLIDKKNLSCEHLKRRSRFRWWQWDSLSGKVTLTLKSHTQRKWACRWVPMRNVYRKWMLKKEPVKCIRWQAKKSSCYSTRIF